MRHLAFFELFLIFRSRSVQQVKPIRRVNLIGGEMYKAFLLILCLLVCTMMVVGQERAPQSAPFSPSVQRILDRINAMTPEQRARLRESTLAWLDERHASEQSTIPMPSQNPLTPFAAMSPLGTLLDVTQDPNLRKYGPLGPNVKYGLLGPLGEEQGAGQSANGGPNQGVVLNLPEGFTHPLDGFSLPGFKESIEVSANAAVDALNQLPRLVAASNQPPVPRSAPPRSRNTGGASAQAAAHPNASDIRMLDRARLPQSGRLIVRSNPKGYYVGSLDINQGDQFQVKAKHISEDGKNICWALGDTLGTVKLNDVWVNCNGLKGAFENVRETTETPNPGYQSRRHLEDRFASLVAPVTHADEKGPKDAKDYVVVTQDTIVYGNYPLSQPANPDGSKPLPGTFSDELGEVLAAPCHAFKVRFFSNDGNAVVGRSVLIDPKTHEAVEGVSRWGILPTANISLPLREGQVACK